MSIQLAMDQGNTETSFHPNWRQCVMMWRQYNILTISALLNFSVDVNLRIIISSSIKATRSGLPLLSDTFSLRTMNAGAVISRNGIVPLPQTTSICSIFRSNSTFTSSTHFVHINWVIIASISAIWWPVCWFESLSQLVQVYYSCCKEMWEVLYINLSWCT